MKAAFRFTISGAIGRIAADACTGCAATLTCDATSDVAVNPTVTANAIFTVVASSPSCYVTR